MLKLCLNQNTAPVSETHLRRPMSFSALVFQSLLVGLIDGKGVF